MPRVGRDTWVFGYGSLMWRPGFDFAEAHHARLTGFRRSFCVYSVHYRGTPRRPGLVLGLDRGGTCEGLAFRLASGSVAQATLDYLRERELVYGVYREVELPVTLLSGDRRSVLAMAFVAERAHPAYAGCLPLASQLALIRGAKGEAGTNLDYLVNTGNHLRELGIREPDLERLRAGAGALAAREDGPLRPSARALAAAWAARPARTPRIGRDRRFIYRGRLGSRAGEA